MGIPLQFRYKGSLDFESVSQGIRAALHIGRCVEVRQIVRKNGDVYEITMALLTWTSFGCA